MKRHGFFQQRGVAVVTALLLTTLAITIVASLFWQQQVQVRSIENQRLQLQKQWILRGALDWTRLILREDARSSTVDHLGEPWAVPLAETRLEESVEYGRADPETADAALSGSIIDAQSRFNLANVCQNGKVQTEEVAVFAKLLSQAGQNPALAQATAELMASAQSRQNTAATTEARPVAASAQQAEPLDILRVEDLLAVPNFTPEALASIKDFIMVLPRPTPINVNTAPAEVLAARIATLSLSDAAALVSSRQSAWFKDLPDFQTRLVAQAPSAVAKQVDVKTGYFLINGNVRLSRAGMQMQALIERGGSQFNPTTTVVWIRES